MRSRLFFFSSALALTLLAAGCAVDDDLIGTAGGADTGGSSSTGDAEPTIDSSMPVDTGMEEDTGTPVDSTVPDTGMKDTAVPDIFGIDTMGFDFAAVDTVIPDTFVAPDCKVASDCPFADTECAKRACVSGRCQLAFTATGTPTSKQTAGDCKKNQCNGAGLEVTVYDPADLPPPNDCIDYSCKTADLTFSFKPARTACKGGICDGAGVCVQCLNVSDCSSIAPTECSFPGCVAGKCTPVGVGAGTVTEIQSPGDCKLRTCDGKGGVTKIDDNSDVPAPIGPCAVGACVGGVPTQQPKDPAPPPSGGETGPSVSAPSGGGTACYTYDSCDDGCYVTLYCAPGKTYCGQCDTAADCTGTPSQCNQIVCEDHTCKEKPLPDSPAVACTIFGCSSTCTSGYCPYICGQE